MNLFWNSNNVASQFIYDKLRKQHILHSHLKSYYFSFPLKLMLWFNLRMFGKRQNKAAPRLLCNSESAKMKPVYFGKF